MKIIFKSISIVELESRLESLNFDRWYYDNEIKQGLVILKDEE